MTDDLRALSAAATPGPWTPHPGATIHTRGADSEFIVALVNTWRSGALTETAPLRALVDGMRTRADTLFMKSAAQADETDARLHAVASNLAHYADALAALLDASEADRGE